jgi:hypothetical protein
MRRKMIEFNEIKLSVDREDEEEDDEDEDEDEDILTSDKE